MDPRPARLARIDREATPKGRVLEVRHLYLAASEAGWLDVAGERRLLELDVICGLAHEARDRAFRCLGREPDARAAVLGALAADALGREEEAENLLHLALGIDETNISLIREIGRRKTLDRAKAAGSAPKDARPPAVRESLHFVTVLFGEAFIRIAARVMVASLYQGNADLLEGRRLTHRFYVPQADRDALLRALDGVLPAGVDVRIDTEILDEAAKLPAGLRYHLHLPYRDAFQRGFEAGAPVILAPPDHVFSGGLKRCLGRLQPGALMVAGHPRLDWPLAEAVLIGALQGGGGLDAAAILDLAFGDARHPMIDFGLAQANPYWRAERAGDQVKVRFKEPPPLMLDPVPDLIALMDHGAYVGPYETLDHDLVEYAFRQGRLAWVADSEVFLWAELTAPESYNPTIVNTYLTRSSLHFQATPLNWQF